jgi:hypothetical protein
MTVYFRYHLPIPLSRSSRKMHNPAIGSYTVSNNVYLYRAAVTARSESYASDTFLLIRRSTLIPQIPLVQVRIVEPHIILVISLIMHQLLRVLIRIHHFPDTVFASAFSCVPYYISNFMKLTYRF